MTDVGLSDAFSYAGAFIAGWVCKILKDALWEFLEMRWP